ncbi:hypothetical protein BB558_001671, partial [Smittium angustum]
NSNSSFTQNRTLNKHNSHSGPINRHVNNNKPTNLFKPLNSKPNSVDSGNRYGTVNTVDNSLKVKEMKSLLGLSPDNKIPQTVRKPISVNATTTAKQRSSLPNNLSLGAKPNNLNTSNSFENKDENENKSAGLAATLKLPAFSNKNNQNLKKDNSIMNEIEYLAKTYRRPTFNTNQYKAPTSKEDEVWRAKINNIDKIRNETAVETENVVGGNPEKSVGAVGNGELGALGKPNNLVSDNSVLNASNNFSKVNRAAKKRQFILDLDVETHEFGRQNLRVFEGDDPKILARTFCETYNMLDLALGLQTVLETKIKKNLKTADTRKSMP